MSELEIMFRIIRCHNYCLALNHLIILGKYFLYVNALNTIKYNFDDFASLVRKKINIEKYIAATCNKRKNLGTNGNFFCPYKITLCPSTSQLLYFDFLAIYLFNNLLNPRKPIPYIVKVTNKILIRDSNN